MQAQDAARLAAGGTRLATEAWCVGGVANRQIRTVEDLVAMHVRHRHLGGWRQIEAVATDHVHLVFLVGDLPCAACRRLVDQNWWPDLGEAVLAHVGVEEQIDERADECGAVGAIRRERCTRHLRAALKIEDAKSLRDHIVLWRCCGGWIFALRANRWVPCRGPGTNRGVRLGATNRNVFVGRVRNAQEQIFELRLGGGELLLEPLHLGGDLLGFSLECNNLWISGRHGWLAAEQRANLGREALALGAQGVHPLRELATRGVCLKCCVNNLRVFALGDRARAESVGVVA